MGGIMTRPPFEPIGEQARWRTLVDLFAKVDRGAVVTFEDLAEELGLDSVQDRRAIQAAVNQAQKTLSREHDRSLTSVRGVGYRVALPDEHVDLAGRQQRKGRRALQRAQVHVDHVDLSALSDEGRQIVYAAARALAWQQQQIKRLDLRQKDLERVLAGVTTRQERTEAEHGARISELEKRIQELG
jgi:hypothetical protein